MSEDSKTRRASCRGVGWTLKQYLLHSPGGGGVGVWLTSFRTGFKKASEERVRVDIKVRGCLRVKPFHVATTPRLLSSLLFQTHGLLNTGKNAQTLFLVSILVSPDAPASGISSVSHVTGWRCDSCPYARLSLAKVTTHTNTVIHERYTGGSTAGLVRRR